MVILAEMPSAAQIDNRLHAERVAPDHSKRSFPAALDDLPDGVFVTVPAWGGQTYLVWGGRLLAWSPGGYRERRPRPRGKGVRVLTPKSTVAAIRAGYIPEVHASALLQGKCGSSLFGDLVDSRFFRSTNG